MNAECASPDRHHAGFQVHIRYGRRRLHSGSGSNPTADGLHLELGALTLPEGTSVDLEIEALGRQWLIPSVVAQHDADGIAVRFVEPQPELAAELALVGAESMPPPRHLPDRRPRLHRPGHRADA